MSHTILAGLASSLLCAASALALPPLELEGAHGHVSFSMIVDGIEQPDATLFEEIALDDLDLETTVVERYEAITSDVGYADSGVGLNLVRVDETDLLRFVGTSHGLATVACCDLVSFSRQDITAFLTLHVPDHRRVRLEWDQASDGLTSTLVELRPVGAATIFTEGTSSYFSTETSVGFSVLNLPAGSYRLDLLSSTQNLSTGLPQVGHAAMRVTLRSAELPGPADVDGDGVVGVSDLLAVLAGWGCKGMDCGMIDIDGNAVVDVADLLAVLQAFGS